MKADTVFGHRYFVSLFRTIARAISPEVFALTIFRSSPYS